MKVKGAGGVEHLEWSLTYSKALPLIRDPAPWEEQLTTSLESILKSRDITLQQRSI